MTGREKIVAHITEMDKRVRDGSRASGARFGIRAGDCAHGMTERREVQEALYYLADLIEELRVEVAAMKKSAR